MIYCDTFHHWQGFHEVWMSDLDSICMQFSCTWDNLTQTDLLVSTSQPYVSFGGNAPTESFRHPAWFHSAEFPNKRNELFSPSRSCALPPAWPAFLPWRSSKTMLTAIPRRTRTGRGVCLSAKLSLKRMSSSQTTFHGQVPASPPGRKRPIISAPRGDQPTGSRVHWHLGPHCMGLPSQLPPLIKADSIREQVIFNKGGGGTEATKFY